LSLVTHLSQIILDWLNNRIEGCKNPRYFGEPLRGDYARFWRYRFGNYRVICDIADEKIIVLVLAIGHWQEVSGK